MALNALWSNKFRSSLTILGVLIGVWSVIAMTSLVKGLDNAVQGSIDELGSNVIFIDRFAPSVNDEDLDEDQRNRKFMTVAEADAIRDNCPAVSAVSPENHFWGNSGGNIVKYKGRKANRPALVGVLPEYMKVRVTPLESGRFISKLDDETRAMLCVLGSDVKEALFPEEDPLGKQIRVNNDRFTIIGCFKKKEAMFANEENNKVFIPLKTYMKIHPEDDALTLAVSAQSIGQVEEAKEQITVALRRLRKVPYDKDNDFAIYGQENIKEMVGNITKYIYIAMIVISSVGLMVGGVGVMNIMLVSVTERTREIGVRKAIGAKRNNILWQFLIEAMTLSGSGGVLGILSGVATSLLIGALSPLPFGISFLYVTLGFVVAVSVGLLAGMYPAYRAAKVDPIESLRYE